MQSRVAQPWRKSHKALGVDEVLTDALDRCVDTISVISAGNYIRAISEGIQSRGLGDRLRVVNLVNQSMNNGHAEILIEEGRILRPEERAAFVLEHMPDAGVVRDYTDFQPQAYEAVARKEIVCADRFSQRLPDYIALGVGSGKLWLAIDRVIQAQGLATKLIGVLPAGENGVFNDGKLVEREGKLFTREPFDPQTIADKLCCPYTALKEQLLAARKRGHILAEVNNTDFYSAFVYAENGRRCGEPSATAGFMIYDPEFRATHGISDDSYCVIVHTGYGEFAKWAEKIQPMKIPMPPRMRQIFGLPPLTEEQLADVRAGKYLKEKPWANSNERVGSQNWCV